MLNQVVSRALTRPAALSGYVEQQMQQSSVATLRSVLTLRRLRGEVDRRTASLNRTRSIAGDTEMFRAVLDRANHVTRGWGGHIVLVYLPAPWRYRTVVGQP